MGKAAYKQEPFSLGKIHIDIFKEFLIHIRRDGLHIKLRPDRMDRVFLYIRRIVGDCRLLHQGKFNRLPVIGISLFLDIPGQLIFTAQT